ncbi:MAG: hypothetical protein ABI459_06460, partial [Deltaproteobacteria bacterium]
MLTLTSKPLAVAAALLLGTMSCGAQAGQVTLKSDDGTMNVTGDLLSFVGGMYVVRTDLGDLKIPANRVKCRGE